MAKASNELKAAVRPRARRQLQNPNPQMRARLMDAAAELIREGGLGELRIEDLARRADVSVGTVYLYFDGKSDLFVQLVREFTDRLRRRLDEADGGTGPTFERLSRRLSAYLDFVGENMAGFLHFRNGGAIDTNVGPLAAWALDCHAADLQPLLQTAIDRGEIAPTDPALLAQALVGVIQHLAAHWGERGSERSRDEIEKFLLAFTTLGINPVDGRAGADG